MGRQCKVRAFSAANEWVLLGAQPATIYFISISCESNRSGTSGDTPSLLPALNPWLKGCRDTENAHLESLTGDHPRLRNSVVGSDAMHRHRLQKKFRTRPPAPRPWRSYSDLNFRCNLVKRFPLPVPDNLNPHLSSTISCLWVHSATVKSYSTNCRHYAGHRRTRRGIFVDTRTGTRYWLPNFVFVLTSIDTREERPQATLRTLLGVTQSNAS